MSNEDDKNPPDELARRRGEGALREMTGRLADGLAKAAEGAAESPAIQNAAADAFRAGLFERGYPKEAMSWGVHMTMGAFGVALMRIVEARADLSKLGAAIEYVVQHAGGSITDGFDDDLIDLLSLHCDCGDLNCMRSHLSVAQAFIMLDTGLAMLSWAIGVYVEDENERLRVTAEVGKYLASVTLSALPVG